MKFMSALKKSSMNGTGIRLPRKLTAITGSGGSPIAHMPSGMAPRCSVSGIADPNSTPQYPSSFKNATIELICFLLRRHQAARSPAWSRNGPRQPAQAGILARPLAPAPAAWQRARMADCQPVFLPVYHINEFYASRAIDFLPAACSRLQRQRCLMP
jgi:hypothetical protein